VAAIMNTPKPMVQKAVAVMERKGMVDCKVFTNPKNCKSKKKRKKKKN